MTTLTISTGLSTTVKSAQSKKCRMLSSLRAGTMKFAVARAIINADPLLRAQFTDADMTMLTNKQLPPKHSRSGSISITVDLTDE